MRSLAIPILFLCVCLTSVVYGQATDVCLDCLKRHNPVDGCTTEPNGNTFCGPFRIGHSFFSECMSGVSDQNYESCTKDPTCARQCVLAYQKVHAERCLGNRRVQEGDNYQQLTCADYGRLHFGGPAACAHVDTDKISTYLKNLTSLCGCLTVYGKCDDVAEPQQDDLLLVYIIAPVCSLVVIVALIVCARYLYRYRQRKRRHEQAQQNVALAEISADAEKAKSKPVRITSTMNEYMMRSTSQDQQEVTSFNSHDMASAEQYEDPIAFNDRTADGASCGSGEKPPVAQKQLPHMYENSPVVQLAPRVGKGSRLPVPTPRQMASSSSF